MTNTMPDQPAGPAHSTTTTQTVRRTIACVICQALYAPAPAHTYLLYASPLVFESAFISMCRFCFRCRRPACPECWDHIHGVCGQCTLESHLPFRSEIEPLPGVLLKLPEREQTTLSTVLPERRFVSVYPGRFQADHERDERTTTPPGGRRHTQKALSIAPNTLPQLPIPRELDIDEIITRPDLTIPFAPQTKQARLQQAQPEKHSSAKQAHTRSAGAEKPTPSMRSIVENICINLLLLILIGILLLIVAAEVSPGANTLLMSILHIDIRAEITYLLQLINHLHF